MELSHQMLLIAVFLRKLFFEHYYTANPKVRKAAFVNKLFGIKVTELVLKLYTNYLRK